MPTDNYAGFSRPIWTDPFVTHMNGLLRLGAQRPLIKEDAGMIAQSERSCESSNVFAKFWDEEMKLPKDERSLARALGKMVGRGPILTGAFMQLISSALAFAGPMILKSLLQHFSPNGTKLSTPVLWLLVALMFVCPIVAAVCLQNAIWMFSQIGIRIRSSLMSVAFQKSTRLSPLARQTNSGTINNIFASDTENLQNFLTFVFPIMYSPFQLAVGFALIYQECGPSTFVALGYIVAILPGIMASGIGFGHYITLKLKESDRRIAMTKEILNGIRIIKYYAWEQPMTKKLSDIRKLELGHIQSIFNCWIGISFFMESIGLVSPILVFAVFSFLGNSLTYSKAFTTLSLFTVINGAASMLPGIFSHVSYASAASKRIQNLLSEEEQELYVERNVNITEKSAISFQNASFGWINKEIELTPGGESEPSKGQSDAYQSVATSDVAADVQVENSLPGATATATATAAATATAIETETATVTNRSLRTLSDISLSIPKGSLVAIVGGVGSGKSSFLAAILNDMYKFAGSVTVNAESVSYHSQTPWILNATIRDNITFGLPLDETKLDSVLSRSALEPDLKSLPAGLETEIGERGINLSGGQKARVSFARALYRGADITLFDDPLSAVDANTIETLFFKGIKPMQKSGKTVVLVTHQVHLLSEVDLIVVLDQGKIFSSGTYAEMSSQGLIDKLKHDHVDGTEGDESELDQEKDSSGTSQPGSSDSIETRARRSSSAATPRTRTRSRAASAAAESKKTQSDSKKEEGALIVDEERKEGMISADVYWWFAKAGGLPLVYFIFLLCLGYKACSLAGTFVLAAWGNENSSSFKSLSVEENLTWVGTYAWILLLGLVIVTLRTLVASIHGVRGGYVFHSAMIDRVMRAPVSFFDVTPNGRILNRFTGDLQLADQGLTALMVIVVTLLGDIFAAIIAICIATRGAFLPLLVAMLYSYYVIQRYYRMSNTEVRRLLAISRSPVFTEISQTLSGVSCLRAYDRTTEFVQRLELKTDDFLTLTFIKAKLNCWLSIRNDSLGALVSFFIVCLAVATTDFVAPESLAVALNYSFIVPICLVVIFNLTAEIEGQMSAIERIKEYAENVDVEEDVPVPVQGGGGVPDGWPSQGVIRVEDLHMRYRDGPLVLKGLSFEIKSGQKVGIAGRTGSGKSSLLAALFRIVKPQSGTIWIDGIDISTIPLQTLRSRISIIPQDPTMFCATVRYNLDPLDEFTDAEILDVLQAVNLKEVIFAMPGGLLAPVDEGGENLSLGQRQLICFARALLRRPKVVVLDEATASVDNFADALIQKMLRERLSECTVLTIAHRLHTIVDSDQILMLADGVVAESGPPSELLDKSDGMFKSLWETYKAGPGQG